MSAPDPDHRAVPNSADDREVTPNQRERSAYWLAVARRTLREAGERRARGESPVYVRHDHGTGGR